VTEALPDAERVTLSGEPHVLSFAVVPSRAYRFELTCTQLGALEPKFWTTFCDAIGRPDLGSRQLTDPADQAVVLREVREVFRTRTQAEWLVFFEGRGVCLSPVNTPAEAFSDPHIAARGTVIHAPGLRSVRAPFGVPARPLSPAPEVGQDTDDILRTLA